MIDLLIIVPVAAAAYLATNLDNFILLVSLHARFTARPAGVTAGYVAAMLGIGAIAFTIGKAAELIPVRHIGLLGVIPVAFGIRDLVRLLRAQGKPPDADTSAAGRGAAMFVTLSTQLGNSTDSIVTFAILFAESTPRTDVLIVAAFGGMVCLFAAAAILVVRHAWLAREAQRLGHYVTPLLMIALGLYVLANTGTDLTPG